MSATQAQRDAEMVAWAEAGVFRPTRHSYGEAAKAETRALLEAAGVDVDALEARVGRGRPRLDASSETERWTIRTPRTLAEEARACAADEKRPVAELVRDAVAEYVNAHKAARAKAAA